MFNTGLPLNLCDLVSRVQPTILSCCAVWSDAADEERAVPLGRVSSSHNAEAKTSLTILLECDRELGGTVEGEREEGWV